jgi:hypothetical protein
MQQIPDELRVKIINLLRTTTLSEREISKMHHGYPSSWYVNRLAREMNREIYRGEDGQLKVRSNT